MSKFLILANRELSLHPHYYCMYFPILYLRFMCLATTFLAPVKTIWQLILFLKAALRLLGKRTLGLCAYGQQKGNLTSHYKIRESAPGSMTLSREPQDMISYH